MAYFYKDKNGRLKKYVGEVKFVNGKPVGELVNPVLVPTNVELKPVAEQTVVDSSYFVKVWKDRDGIERPVSECDEIDNFGRAVKRYKDTYNITFHPEVKSETWFSYNGEKYDGEIIEKDGKYYAEI